MNPVVHFEMPYDDSDRAAKFYRAAFGWNMKSLGEEMGNYLLATTTATAPDGRPTKPGAINGGFFAKKPDWPAQYPSVVIAVDDLQAAMAKIADAGGDVLGDPMDIPGIGAYVSFTDTEGNRVGALQPLPMAKAAKKKPVAKKKTAAKKPVKKAVKAKKKVTRKR
jgi:predicted enzyme related to lactoylglutathione lyase